MTPASATFPGDLQFFPEKAQCATNGGGFTDEVLFGFGGSVMGQSSDVMTRRASGATTSGTKDLPHAAAGDPPLVSVIIPYFNHPAYLSATVESARQQTYPNLEIIVVDDGSTLPATSILGDHADILVIRTVNGGVSAARNIGFQNSSGDYLIFLDADDLLLPGAVDAHLKALRGKPDAGLTFGPARIIDGSGKEIVPPKICRPRKEYFPMLLESNPIACPGSTMIRKEAFIEAGFFDTSFRNAEDYHLYLRLARLRPVVQHNTCVVEYRKHSGGKSNNTDRMVAAVMAILDRFEGDPTLSPSERKTLQRGRKRWLHAMLPKATLGYRVTGLYYRFRAMLTVPIRSYFLPRR